MRNLKIDLELVQDICNYIIGAAEDKNISINEYISNLSRKIDSIRFDYGDKIHDDFSDLYDIVYEHYCEDTGQEAELYKTRYFISDEIFEETENEYNELGTNESFMSYIESKNQLLNFMTKFTAYNETLDIIYKMASFEEQIDDYISTMSKVADYVEFVMDKKKTLWLHKWIGKKVKIRLNLNVDDMTKFIMSFVFNEDVYDMVKNSFEKYEEDKIVNVRVINA